MHPLLHLIPALVCVAVLAVGGHITYLDARAGILPGDFRWRCLTAATLTLSAAGASVSLWHILAWLGSAA